jgi:hypothetical protein
MKPRGVGWIWAMSLLPALSGCSDNSNPYGIPPMLGGVVRLDVSMADVDGNPLGTRVITNADGVRAWLVEGSQPVDSALTKRGVYVLTMTKNHTYRAQAGIRPAFVDSTEEVLAARDIGYYPDTLRLARVGDLTSHPNPFQFQVTLLFQIASDTQLEISVYDLSAKRVRVLASRTFVAGFQQILWDGRDDAAQVVADGMYWVLLQSASETRAELVIKQP